MISITLAVDWGKFIPVLFGLFFFGVACTSIMHSLAEKAEGSRSLIVSGGVIIVLIGVAILDINAALLALLCFAVAGAPIIIAEIKRSVMLREKTIERIRQDALRKAGEDDQ